MSATILMVAINARYGHCSFAARTLLANLGALREQAAMLETDLDAQPFQLAAEIAGHSPRVVGFTVYLWNAGLVRQTLGILRRVAPELRVVLGGPEIVAGCESGWRGLADDLVAGEGETAFRRICEEACAGHGGAGDPAPRLTLAGPEDVSQLRLPYDLYSDHDIAHRTIFVEGSRGCPFQCAYCTSGGTGLRVVPQERLLPALDRLLARGVRAFRFLDRSLNASEPLACGLLDFFLERLAAAAPSPRLKRLQLHFEIMPCRLPDSLRQRLAAFPPGVLHLEVGVQTLNEDVARRVLIDLARSTVEAAKGHRIRAAIVEKFPALTELGELAEAS